MFSKNEKINKKDIEDIIALTPTQEGMLYHYLKDHDSDFYFEQLSLTLTGEIDFNCFKQAWDFVVETNEMLRTMFRWDMVKKPVQIILKKYRARIIFHDFSPGDINENYKLILIEEIKEKDRKNRFDLNSVPFRVILCKIDEYKYEMIVSNHHILYDGWSNQVILKEFFSSYNDLVQQKSPVRPIKPRYKEYTNLVQRQDGSKLEKYWAGYLKGFEDKSELSIKKKRGKNIKTAAGNSHYSVKFSKKEREKLDTFTKSRKITLACLLYSAWGILLQKYNHCHDVVFGTTVSGRSAKINGIEDMVGLFINTLPLRVRAFPDENVVNLLTRINHCLETREKYEHTPLVKIKEYSGLGHEEELFDTIAVIENYPLESRLLPENNKLSAAAYSMFDMTHYDLTVDIKIFAEIEIDFSYDNDLFDKEIIIRLSNHFTAIIRDIIKNPGKQITGMDILSGEEKRRLLYDFNNNKKNNEAGYLENKTIHHFFAKQVEKNPDRIALIGMINPKSEIRNSKQEGTGGLASLSITYRELNERSDQSARFLRSAGIERDGLVGILMERSLLMVISILAVWKAGGAYIPVHPGYPVQRIGHILNDSNAPALITTSRQVTPRLEEVYPGRIIPLDVQHMPETRGMSGDAGLVPGMRTLAYVIYTSGSTGNPRGAMVEHTGMMNHIRAKIDDLQMTGRSIVAQNASHTFDISVWQFFTALTLGGRTVIYADELILEPRRFISRLVEDSITILEVVPSYLSIMLEDDGMLAGLDYLLVTGEEIKPRLVKKWFEKYPAVKMVNAYGPTEASDDITHFIMNNPPDTDRVPIGKPLRNLDIYILDLNMQLCPVGVKGEIYVSGVGVGRGYLNNPELTNKKFLRGGSGGAVFSKRVPPDRRRQYKTGDLGRWLPDGTIEFFGRKDYQVKIRGFRIELGEIESRLSRHRAIKEAVVIDREDKAGNKYLCAYVVPGPGQSPGANQLREFLSGSLPGYMIPSYFIIMEDIPLTLNGKTDRKAFPSPELESGHEYTAPRDEIEAGLAAIWSDVLGGHESPGIGIDDNFFTLGGHSLKMTILASRIHKVFDIKIPLGEIARKPSIREMSQYIKQAAKNKFSYIKPVEEKEYHPLSLAQRRLYILNEIGNVGSAYNLPAAWIVEGRLDLQRFEKAFGELIRRHESLRTSFEYRNGGSVQIINNYSDIDFRIEYMEIEGEPGQEEEELRHVIDDFIRPFALGKAPLLRVGLIRMAGDKHLLLFDMHHIISDGVTIVILAGDFIRFYDGKVPRELPIRYKDFTAWQIQHSRSEEMERQELYWLNRFKDGVPVLKLMTDYPRPPLQSFAGASISFEIDRELTAKVRQIVSPDGTTLYVVLLSAYNILLSKYSGQEDIVVGLPIAGRNHTDLENIVGFFVNTLVIRNQPGGDKPVGRFLEEVKTTAFEAYEKQNYPFDQLVNGLNIPRDLSRNPLFDVMFVLQNMDPMEEFEDLTITPYEFERKISHFDLHLQAFEADDTIDMALEYSTALFERATVEEMARNFIQILEQMADNRELRLKEIKISHDLAAAKPKKLREQLGGFDFR